MAHRRHYYPRLSRRDAEREEGLDGPKIFGGLVLLLGAALAYKYLILDKKAPQPAPGALPATPPASPLIPGSGPTLPPPLIPGSGPTLPPPLDPGSGPSPLPQVPGATPLAMSVGRGDTILVSTATVAHIPGLPPGVSAVEMLVVQADPGSPTVQATFTDGNLKSIPPLTIPRQAIVGVVRTTPTPAPGSPGGPPTDQPLFLDDPMRLRANQRYRARIQLSGIQAAMASRPLVEGQFIAIGFRDVTAFEPSSTPADWPASTKRGDLSGTWFVQGTWSQADKDVAKPPQVLMAWEG